MRAVRRHDHAVRFEMTPLIDVIFLLLTFFIYSMVMMVRAEVLPVTLTAMQSGERPSEDELAVLTIDRAGAVYLNREAVPMHELDRRLAELAKTTPPPRLFIGVEAQGDVDRGPLLINLIERVRRAGIENFAIIGQPREEGT